MTLILSKVAAAIAILSLMIGLGYHWGNDKAQAECAKAKAAMQEVIDKQKDDLILAYSERRKAIEASEKKHEEDLKNYSTVVTDFTDRLRKLTAEVRSGSVSGTVANPPSVQTGSGSGGKSEGYERSVDRLLGAVQAAESACLDTWADHKAVIMVEP